MNKNEIKNLEKYIKAIMPASGEIPEINGYDLYGESFQLNKFLGGDHIIYVDFKKRYDIDKLIDNTNKSNKSDKEKNEIIDNLNKIKSKVGILIADVSGHDKTDIVLTNGFHHAFLTGVSYELKHNGDVSKELFDTLNTRFSNSSGSSKYFTLIYMELSQNGEFNFISAGHPLPLIYSYKFEAMCSLHQSSFACSFNSVAIIDTYFDVLSICLPVSESLNSAW
jgi:serine phosphatase RsbU (regulator of sigma subunit)